MAQELRSKSEGTETLPLARLFGTDSGAITTRILDLVLEGYNYKFTENEIAEIIKVPVDDIAAVLRDLLSENILKKEKSGLDLVYKANFSSGRTEALFRYARATLDENFESNIKAA